MKSFTLFFLNSLPTSPVTGSMKIDPASTLAGLVVLFSLLHSRSYICLNSSPAALHNTERAKNRQVPYFLLHKENRCHSSPRFLLCFHNHSIPNFNVNSFPYFLEVLLLLFNSLYDTSINKLRVSYFSLILEMTTAHRLLPVGSRRQPSSAAASLNHNNIILSEKFHSFSYPNTHTHTHTHIQRLFKKKKTKNRSLDSLSALFRKEGRSFFTATYTHTHTYHKK